MPFIQVSVVSIGVHVVINNRCLHVINIYIYIYIVAPLATFVAKQSNLSNHLILSYSSSSQQVSILIVSSRCPC